MSQLQPFHDPLPLPPVLDPSRVGPDGTRYYRVAIRNGRARFHGRLPEADIYGYDGFYPGPTIVARTGERVVVEFANELQGGLPFVGVSVPPTAQEPFPQDHPGRAGAAAIDPLPDLRWVVVHLHGNPSLPSSDGYPDSAYFPGESALNIYKDQRGPTLLWYHDHADMITRLNVYAGLAALYLVRDDVEAALGLPCGPPYEVPLVLQDRNLDLDEATGQFTGRLLYKLAAPGAEFFGPYTLVNGVIWPYLEVEPRPYRLRILNGSNGRFYRLRLDTGNGAISTAEFTQIGVDGGFLDAPTPIPPEGLTLAPAERADVILDLRAHAGKHVRLVNDHPAFLLAVPPAQGTVPHPPLFPEVLELRVGHHHHQGPVALPATLPTTPAPDPNQAARRRLIVLVEVPVDPNQPAGDTVLLINNRFFHDTIEEIPTLGDVEVWEFLNATGDIHPMHLHLVDFRVLGREPVTYDVSRDDFVARYQDWTKQDPAVRPSVPPGFRPSGTPRPPDANERGPKDTVRAYPDEITRIVARFAPHAGLYVYHCHILEHEDMEMMRPYLVMPPGLTPMTKC